MIYTITADLVTDDNGLEMYPMTASSFVAEMQPALEYCLDADKLVADDDKELAGQGIVQIIAGEMGIQLLRGRTIDGEAWQYIDLIRAGAEKLAPYLKDGAK